MIEPTDEMGALFQRTRLAYWTDRDHQAEPGGPTTAEHERAAVMHALAAVLAVVERDYRMVRICGAQLGTSMRCERAEHDEGDHEAIAPGGSLVRWL